MTHTHTHKHTYTHTCVCVQTDTCTYVFPPAVPHVYWYSILEQCCIRIKVQETVTRRSDICYTHLYQVLVAMYVCVCGGGGGGLRSYTLRHNKGHWMNDVWFDHRSSSRAPQHFGMTHHLHMYVHTSVLWDRPLLYKYVDIL